MQRIIIGIIAIVALLAVAAHIYVPVINWDGMVLRQVKVLVQTSDGSPVPGAKVTFRDSEYDWVMKQTNTIAHMSENEMQKWKSQHYASGLVESDGSFIFRARFGAGEERTLLWRTGHFGIRGTILIQAEGYQPFERSLADLVGQTRMPVRKYKRKPIVVRCSLEKD